jgi:hypothetical protein
VNLEKNYFRSSVKAAKGFESRTLNTTVFDEKYLGTLHSLEMYLTVQPDAQQHEEEETGPDGRTRQLQHSRWVRQECQSWACEYLTVTETFWL